MTGYTDKAPAILQEELVRIAKRAYRIHSAVRRALGDKDIPAWDDLHPSRMGASMDLCRDIVEYLQADTNLDLIGCDMDERVQYSIYIAVVEDALKRN